MHLADGIVPVEMAFVGYVASAGMATLALRRLHRLPDPAAAVPRAAMMTTVFFAATLVAIPVPPASVHLVLVGLMGVMLGWFAVPAILVGLFLQAVLFGHGGLTALGLNGLIFGLPALMAFAIWHVWGRRWPDCAAFCAGGGAVALALTLFGTVVLLGLPVTLDAGAERTALAALALAHIPLVLAEGIVVLAFLRALRRIEPGLIPNG